MGQQKTLFWIIIHIKKKHERIKSGDQVSYKTQTFHCLDTHYFVWTTEITN